MNGRDTMSLTLSDVRRIAADEARREDPALEVIGAHSREGGSISAEVVLTIRGCRVEPCQMIIGVPRNASEGECRGAVRARLKEHLAEHRAT
jgi:hypothetical protein